jgi:hypothetical protein
MTLKYLYIDDDTKDEVGRIATDLSISEKLEVIYEPVSFFKDQVAHLLRNQHYDGLLLDLRLDLKKRENGEVVEFTATTLAQYLRSKVYDTEEPLRDFPILLCSQQNRIDMFEVDLSSHDLFDHKFRKEDVEKHAKDIGEKMIALAEGYKAISDAEDWNQILNYQSKTLDSRMFGRFINKTKSIASHEYARHIMREIIIPTTDLISESILAARLGIDDACTGWPELRETIFSSAKYTGVFSSKWERWWQPSIDRIFESLSGTSLSSLDAHRRVAILAEKTGILNLLVAPAIQHNSSYWYWTICQALKRPLDPSEGFRLSAHREPSSWQDYDYISLEALLERMHETDLHRELHPDDQIRFNIIKDSY